MAARILITDPAFQVEPWSAGQPVLRAYYEFGQSEAVGPGQIPKLRTSRLATITPSLTRTFDRSYIWNRDAQARQKYQVDTNAQGFDPAVQGPQYDKGFCSMLGVIQRAEQLYPNDYNIIIKGGRGQTDIESFFEDAGDGQNNLFHTLLNEVILPGNQAVQDLAAELGATIEAVFVYWQQGETQPTGTYSTYAAAQTKFLVDELKPRLLWSPGTKFVIGDTVMAPAINAIKRSWVAGRTDAVSVSMERMIHLDVDDDDIHWDAKSTFNNGFISIPEAIGWIPTTSKLFMRLRPAHAGNSGGLLLDESGWYNDLGAKSGEEGVLAVNPATNRTGLTVGSAHIAKLTPVLRRGVQRMENVPKRVHFVAQQPATGTALRYVFSNLGLLDVLPGFGQGIVALDGTYVGGQRDASAPCVISAVQSTVSGTATTTVYFNGTAVGSKAMPFNRLEGNTGQGFALLSPPTNQYDDQAALPGDWVMGLDAYVGEISGGALAAEIAAIKTEFSIGGTTPPPAPSGYQATYTDTVPADA